MVVAPVQPQISGVVAQAAAAAALFKPGQVLEALVLGKTPDGLVALKIGDVVVNAQLPQALPPGTTLQLQVKVAGPAPQLLMVGTPQLPAQPVPVAPAPVMPLPLPPVTVSQLPAATPAAQAQAAPPQVAPTPPAIAPAPMVPTPTTPAAAPAASVSNAPVQPTASPPVTTTAAPPPPVTSVPVPVTAAAPAVQPPPAPPSPPAPALAAPQIAESVQSVAPATATIASTPAGAPPPQPPAPSVSPQPAANPPVTPQPTPTVSTAASPPAPTSIVAPAAVPTSIPATTSVPPPAAPVPTAPGPTAIVPPAVAAPVAPATSVAAPATPAPGATQASVPPAQAASPLAATARSAPPAASTLPAQAVQPPAPISPQPASIPAQPAPPIVTAQPSPATPVSAPPPASAPAIPSVQPEPAAPSPLLVAQVATRPAMTVADLPRPAPLPGTAPQGQAAAPAPATPAAALAQMVPEALARQNSVAPLLASLAAIVAKPGALPEPVLRAALQVLGQRVQIPPSGPTAGQLETAIAKSGIYLEAGLAKGTPAADLKSGLVALKGALATWLGGNPAPVTAAQQAAPPLRGMPARAEALDLPPLPDAPREAARALHSQADAALSRVKLMQLASLPDADPVRPAPPELRLEVPFLLGQQLVMAQFQVTRDAARHKSEGKRGWTMRFAMTLPAAGEVGAEIGLLGRSVNVALWAADADMAAQLEAALPELAPALTALGLEPGAVRVRNLPPEAPKPASGQYLDSRR